MSQPNGPDDFDVLPQGGPAKTTAASKKPVGRPPHPTGDSSELDPSAAALASARSDFETIRKREWPAHVRLQRRLGNVESIAKRDDDGRVIRAQVEVTLRDGTKRMSPKGYEAQEMPEDFVPDVIRPGSQDAIVRRLVQNLLISGRKS